MQGLLKPDGITTWDYCRYCWSVESLPSLYGTPFEVHNTEPKGEEVEKEDEEEKIKTMHYQEAQALATCCKSQESRDESRGEITGQN